MFIILFCGAIFKFCMPYAAVFRKNCSGRDEIVRVQPGGRQELPKNLNIKTNYIFEANLLTIKQQNGILKLSRGTKPEREDENFPVDIPIPMRRNRKSDKGGTDHRNRLGSKVPESKFNTDFPFSVKNQSETK